MSRRPVVTLSFTQSLDGRIALANTRTHLSSKAGLEFAHRCRAEHDAVLVGSSTVKIDDPQMTVRYSAGSDPKRIVLASRLDIPTSARIFTKGPGLLVIGATASTDPSRVAACRDAGAEVRLVASRPDGGVVLTEALRAAWDWGVRRLLVEGGARVLSSFVRERLADRVFIEVVPKLLGELGVNCVADLAVSRLEDCPQLTEVSVEHLEPSIMIRGKLAS